MAVIDTLKLARALHDKGGFSQESADATAEAINAALGEDVATKSDISYSTVKSLCCSGRAASMSPQRSQCLSNTRKDSAAIIHRACAQ
ncbi:MAG: hypothetical protein E6G90_16200 [Alphaproteobacteria bacterium]|nr:MAG: hypothetical protein E6G90_16200 [Alphaproteobacteria bacterium]